MKKYLFRTEKRRKKTITVLMTVMMILSNLTTVLAGDCNVFFADNVHKTQTTDNGEFKEEKERTI